jgi:hypothetical protein
VFCVISLNIEDFREEILTKGFEGTEPMVLFDSEHTPLTEG